MMKRANSFEIIDSQEVVSLASIRNRYDGVKVLLIVSDVTNINNLSGKVYAISKSKSSFKRLCELSKRLKEENNIQSIIVGNYPTDSIYFDIYYP